MEWWEDQPKAAEWIKELKETARHRYVSGFFLAEAFAGLGQRDQAISSLEQAYEEHDEWMVFANSHPGLGSLALRDTLSGADEPHELPGEQGLSFLNWRNQSRPMELHHRPLAEPDVNL